MIQKKLLIIQMLIKSKTRLINKDLDFLYGWLQANAWTKFKRFKERAYVNS